MLDVLQSAPGTTIAGLSAHFDMSGVGVLKHVRVLEAAGLIWSRKEGRERRLYFNLVPIQSIYDRWTDRYSRFWAERVIDMKARIEASVQRRRGGGARRPDEDRKVAGGA